MVEEKSKQLGVLIIASDFPPLVGTNTQRMQSFLRHLPKFGWHCRLMTQDIDDLPAIDLLDLARIPDSARVIRIPNPDIFARRARGVRKAQKSIALDPQDSNSYAESLSANRSLRSKKNISKAIFLTPTSNLLQWGLRTFCYHPDSLRPWANLVAKKAIIEFSGGVHAILSSSPAYSCHMAGLQIKKHTGLPWIADFRDLWVGRPYRTYYSNWHKWLDQKLEAQVVKHCDSLLLASPAWEQVFISRYGDAVREKITVLTNGYESDFIDQNNITSHSHQGLHKFLLTGSMHEAESPLTFLEALNIIHKEHPGALDQVEVTFIGNAGEHLPALKDAAVRTGMADRIVFLTPRSNEECIKLQLAADCLIMFLAAGHHDTISGKSFEYMATGKPILACVPPTGIQADILKKAGNAIVVPYGDTQATVSAILRLLRQRPDASLQPDWPYIRQFDRAQLAFKLARILDKLANR